MPMTLLSTLQKMPKAELHVHIEGTLEPEMIFALAARNGVHLPFESVAALRTAYDFANLQAFLDVYYVGASILLTQSDFYEMTWAYLLRAKADHVVHAEIFFDPQTHTERGVSFEAIISGIDLALQRGKIELGISSGLIMCFLRHLPEDAAFATLDTALLHRDKFIGVGLDSSEKDNPPEKFERVYARAKALGLRLVAHAGEEGPPDYIRSALDVLHAERIDHGVRCVEDPALMDRLAREHVPLTVCPLSNVKLRVFDRLEDHNLLSLLDAGIRVTVNSDDPAYFGGYINANLEAVCNALPVKRHHAYQIAQNSFTASFLPVAAKRAYLAQLDAFFDAI
ncbi:MAG: adenosine deaminase [Burkholderiaceae bacterium]